MNNSIVVEAIPIYTIDGERLYMPGKQIITGDRNKIAQSMGTETISDIIKRSKMATIIPTQ